VDNFPKHGIEARTDHRNRPLMDMIREAVKRGMLPATMISQVQGLQTLRNLAAHSPNDPTTEQAQEFLTIADAVLYLMQTGLE
jgi:hypothetical protein